MCGSRYDLAGAVEFVRVSLFDAVDLAGHFAFALGQCDCLRFLLAAATFTDPSSYAAPVCLRVVQVFGNVC